MDEWKRLKLAFAIDKWSTRFAGSVFVLAIASACLNAAQGHWGEAATLLVVTLAAARVACWVPPLITFKNEDKES